MARLVDHAQRQAEGTPPKISDILGQEVSVQGVEFLSGKFGEYALFEIIDDNGEIQRIQTTGMLVIDALKHAEAEEAFPVLVTFKRNDRTYTME